VTSILPALAPEVGSATCTAFGTVAFAAKFSDDVVGAPVASPGRTDRNPEAVGETTVTFSRTPVAPTGTVAPTTWTFWDTADTNGPGKPRFTGSRVSSIRTGSTVTTADGSLEAALAKKAPPPPSATATAAPTAAHRDLHILLSLAMSTKGTPVPG
jgi:hypothetical protein